MPTATSRLPKRSHPERTLQPEDLLALYSAATLRAFVEQTFELLPQMVTCDYVSVFYQRAGEGFLKEWDSRGRVWNRAFMRRFVELTPAVPLVLANPGVKVLPTRLAISACDLELHGTAFYREVMQRQGWRHGAALCFWAAPASFPIFVLTLYRGEGRPDFNDRELRVLESLHPFLAPAVDRFHEISAAAATREGVSAALRHVSPEVVVLDWQLRVVHATAAGRRSLAEWNRTSAREGTELPGGTPPVSGGLLQVCQELHRELISMKRRKGGSRAQRRRYVSHPDSLGPLASVTAISLGTALAEPSFVIAFERPRRPDARMSDRPSPLAQLTKSESQVALVIAEGYSNQEAAERLGKTVHAVKFLLHRTYKKLGVPNRARLAVLLRRNG